MTCKSSVIGYSSEVPASMACHDTPLPFTGMDAGLFAAGGLLLVAVGCALRRAVRTNGGPNA